MPFTKSSTINRNYSNAARVICWYELRPFEEPGEPPWIWHTQEQLEQRFGRITVCACGHYWNPRRESHRCTEPDPIPF